MTRTHANTDDRTQLVFRCLCGCGRIVKANEVYTPVCGRRIARANKKLMETREIGGEKHGERTEKERKAEKRSRAKTQAQTDPRKLKAPETRDR